MTWIIALLVFTSLGDAFYVNSLERRIRRLEDKAKPNKLRGRIF